MPQATDELRARWGGEQGVGEDKAWAHLNDRDFTMDRGVIRAPVGWNWRDPKVIKEDTWGAVAFLCDEWDYDYEPTGS